MNRADHAGRRPGARGADHAGRRTPRPTALRAPALQLTDPVIGCPDCQELLPRSQLDGHLRRAHQVYLFRGVRRTFTDAVALRVEAICGQNAGGETWNTLEAMTQELYGNQAGAYLAAAFARALDAPSADGGVALDAAARTLAASEQAADITAALVADPGTPARLLALALAARLPAARVRPLVPALGPLLHPRGLPADAQLATAAALLHTFGGEDDLAAELFGSLTAGLGKRKSIERLRQLAVHTGPLAALDEYGQRIENRLRMSCPRCGIRLRRRRMVRHLWLEHGLLLDGRRVREPWQLIADWLTEYRERPDRALLERCHALAERVDAADGPRRLQRLLLAHGVEDAEARLTLLAEAFRRQASLCPSCYALVPVPTPVPVQPLNAWRGRLTAGGYRVEVADGGLLTRLEIDRPAGVFFRGCEPDRLLTRKGATLLLVGPLVLTALAVACLLPAWPVLPLLLVLGLLLGALGVYAAVRRQWRARAPLADRAADYAWTYLAPLSHTPDFSLEDSAFLAGLALTSLEQGQARQRERLLEHLLSVTEKAVARGARAGRHLAALRRLAVADAAGAGRDPVPLVVQEISRCFEGRLPLVVADGLLAGWQSPLWTAGNLARLRVLLCDRAFEAGLELRDLLELGRLAPTLGTVLGTEDPDRLAELRLLWSLRPRRPWHRCGEPRTAFELGATPEAATLLGKYPDLLLYEAVAPPPGAVEKQPWAEILTCGRGLLFEGTVFTGIPREVSVEVSRSFFGRGGYELALGEFRYRFAADPEPLVTRLERWFRFHFGDFVPQVAAVVNWQSPGVPAALRAEEATVCPECGRVLLPCVGDVGIAVN